MTSQFGMIGLGTMGRNLLLNISEKGFRTAGFDIDPAKRQLLIAEAEGRPVIAAENLAELVADLEQPRIIMLLVPAGPIVDSVIDDLLPHLQPGDIVIDGGNSHFRDSERREAFLNERGLEFIGVGVSGGEEGARHGASIMIGGKRELFERISPFFEAAAAKVAGDPCAARVGRGPSGHFVKMVHNGIEYAMMQSIAEAYDLLKRGLNLRANEIADIFAEWDQGDLSSYLIGITSIVLRKLDDKTGRPLVDLILDTAGQKGTGKWTSQTAMDLGVPVPTIDAAVTMRQISARKEERLKAAKIYEGLFTAVPARSIAPSDIQIVHDALHLSFVTAYAQGFSMLAAASEEFDLELDLPLIAKIWRGGCIIRAAMLEDIRSALIGASQHENLIYTPQFRDIVRQKNDHLKAFVQRAISLNVPCMAAAASLGYLYALTSERLPANLIQAQRDYFGAHTYRRVDIEGTFHTDDW